MIWTAWCSPWTVLTAVRLAPNLILVEMLHMQFGAIPMMFYMKIHCLLNFIVLFGALGTFSSRAALLSGAAKVLNSDCTALILQFRDVSLLQMGLLLVQLLAVILHWLLLLGHRLWLMLLSIAVEQTLISSMQSCCNSYCDTLMHMQCLLTCITGFLTLGLTITDDAWHRALLEFWHSVRADWKIAFKSFALLQLMLSFSQTLAVYLQWQVSFLRRYLALWPTDCGTGGLSCFLAALSQSVSWPHFQACCTVLMLYMTHSTWKPSDLYRRSLTFSQLEFTAPLHHGLHIDLPSQCLVLLYLSAMMLLYLAVTTYLRRGLLRWMLHGVRIHCTSLTSLHCIDLTDLMCKWSEPLHHSSRYSNQIWFRMFHVHWTCFTLWGLALNNVSLGHSHIDVYFFDALIHLVCQTIHCAMHPCRDLIKTLCIALAVARQLTDSQLYWIPWLPLHVELHDVTLHSLLFAQTVCDLLYLHALTFLEMWTIHRPGLTHQLWDTLSNVPHMSETLSHSSWKQTAHWHGQFFSVTFGLIVMLCMLCIVSLFPTCIDDFNLVALLCLACLTIYRQGNDSMLWPQKTIRNKISRLMRRLANTPLHWLTFRFQSVPLHHSFSAHAVFQTVNFSTDPTATPHAARPAQRPVPSPVTVPCRYRMHWWMWFWMYTAMTLNPLAPEFFPASSPTTHAHTHHNIDAENRGGEGRGMPVSASEAVSPEITRMLQHCCSELHGMEQHGGHGGHTTVKKRSFARACRRALRTGYTTYRGTLMTPNDFPHYLTKQISRELAGKPTRFIERKSPETRPTKKSRLNIFLWNPGGLSTSRFQELLLWLNANKVDLAVIPETRWSLETDWSTVAPDGSRWHCVHSGRSGHSGGVMILLSASTCRVQDLHWKVVCQGRLLHVRISSGTRATDVLGLYQYVHRDDNRVLRRQLLTQLQDYLGHLPKRNTLILAGDFNTSLTTMPGYVASATFQWKGGRTQGAQHSDTSDLMQVLQQHGLVALNTWNGTHGPTFVGPQHVSRIDFLLTRRQSADHAAKKVRQITDFPMLQDQGHVPLLTSMPKSWVPYKDRTLDFRFTLRHRLLTRMLRQTDDPLCRSWVDQSTTRLTQLLQQDAFWSATPEIQLAQLNETLKKDCASIFAQAPLLLAPQPEPDPLQHHVECKWTHWQLSRAQTTSDLRSCFLSWRHWTSFLKLDREQQRVARRRKRAKIEHLMDQAATAAEARDPQQLFHLVDKLAPKARGRRIQLRTQDNQLASPSEQFSILSGYVQTKWKSHSGTPPPPRDFPPPGVPFSMEDFVAELGKLPPTKAVASPFAPAIAWREHASTIGPVIYENLQKLWCQAPPQILRDWKQGWLSFLPKPGKPTDKPDLLRPIALLNPVGKAALRLITREAMAYTLPNLVQAPQFAFWPGRSTTDAIARVMDHNRSVNGLLLAQSNKILLQHSGQSRLACCGGIQVFLDLTQAFDCVPRDRLTNAILALLPRADLANLLIEWHHDTSYHISHLNFEDELATTLGVRQGCPSAPLLWTLFLHHCMTEFDPSWQWLRDHITLFADDMQLHQLVQDENDVFAFLTKLGQLFDHLKACGLRLSAEKSVALLSLTGDAANKLQAKIVERSEQGVFLVVPTQTMGKIRIRLCKQASYLGVIAAYHQSSTLTMAHRLQAAKKNYGRMKHLFSRSSKLNLQTRSKLWHAVIQPMMTYGIFGVGMTLPDFLKLQTMWIEQLRTVAHNHSHLTKLSHTDFLATFGWQQPATVLLKALYQFRRRLQWRHETQPSHDVTHQLNWTHLDQLEYILMQAETCSPTRTAVRLELATHHCPLCGYNCVNDGGVTLHLRLKHNIHHFARRRPNYLVDHSDGLPTCAHCGKTFTTWGRWKAHVSRHILEVPQAPTTMAASSDAAPGPPDAAADLVRDPLRFWLQQPAGRQLTPLIQANDWDSVKQERDALSWVREHCVLCGLYTPNIRAMNYHLRTGHPDHLGDVFNKVNGFLRRIQTGHPCALCGREIQNAKERRASRSVDHLCPIGQQLYIISYLLENQALDTPALATTTSFRMTRDAVLGQPICAHCGLTVDTMPGLRNHINRRACKKFDPDASDTPIPPTAEIREALTRGTVPQILASPMERTRWTLQCQCCGMAFTTQVNSYRHLTEEHIELLNQAWPHIQQLHAQLRLFGACLCNPGPARRLDNVHSCLPLIQMGMQYVRLRQLDQIGLLLPCPFSESSVSRGIARDVDADILSLLHHHLPARDVTQFWTLPALLMALRERCLICPIHDQRDGLAMHLRDKHCQALTGLTALTTQIFHVTRRPSHGNSAPNCPLCRLPDCSAQTCTVAHNIATVITGVADGHGISGNDGVPGVLPPPDTSSPDSGERGQGGRHCPTTEAVTRPRQAATTSHTDGQRQRKRKGQVAEEETSSSRRRLHEAFAEGSRPFDAEGGTAGAPTNDPDLHGDCNADGQRWSSAPPGGLGQSMEGPEGEGHRDNGTAPTSLEGPVQPASNQSGACCELEGSRPDVSAGENQSFDRALQRLDTLRLVPKRSDTEGGQLQASYEDANDDLHHADAGGHGVGPRSGPSLSCDGQNGCREPFGEQLGLLETPPVHETGRTMADAVPNSIHGSLVLGGGEMPPMVSETLQSGDTAAISPAGLGLDLLPLAEAKDPYAFRLLHLRLANDANHCYSNAAWFCGSWAVLCTHFEAEDWGQQRDTMSQLLTANPAKLETLTLLFPTLFQFWSWGHGEPADSAEFTGVWLRWLKSPRVNLSWERRLQQKGAIQVFDRSDNFMPTCLQAPMTDLRTEASHPLQQLIDMWHTTNGMLTGFVGDTDLVCFHLDRYDKRGTRIMKRHWTLQWEEDVLVPFFADDLCLELCAFTPVSLVTHKGDESGGHYQSYLLVNAGRDVVWFQTDDGMEAQPVQTSIQHPDIAANITMIWLCRKEKLDLHRPLDHPGHWHMVYKKLQAYYPDTTPHDPVRTVAKVEVATPAPARHSEAAASSEAPSTSTFLGMFPKMSLSNSPTKEA